MPSKEEKNAFSILIEKRALEENVKHMEAIIDHCEEIGLELEVAATLLNSSLKIKIENEAKELRFLPQN